MTNIKALLREAATALRDYERDSLAAKLEDAAEVDAARYHELLYAVQHKHSGETRHETALRYIQQAETPNGLAKEQGHE